MLVHVLDLLAHGIGVGAHGAEFGKGEDAAVAAHAFLPVQHRAAVFELDGQRHEAEERREQEQGGGDSHHVDGAFDGLHALRFPPAAQAGEQRLGRAVGLGLRGVDGVCCRH